MRIGLQVCNEYGPSAMGRRTQPLVLSEQEKLSLEQAVKRHIDWRVRERAQTILLLGQGWDCANVAQRQGLCVLTVRTTRRAWRDEGLAGLADKHRCGAPPKLADSEVQRLVQWASDEPLTAPALLARHQEAAGTAVHLNTLMSALKRRGLVWKRTRHSLKKDATPHSLSKPAATSKP